MQQILYLQDSAVTGSWIEGLYAVLTGTVCATDLEGGSIVLPAVLY